MSDVEIKEKEIKKEELKIKNKKKGYRNNY